MWTSKQVKTAKLNEKFKNFLKKPEQRPEQRSCPDQR